MSQTLLFSIGLVLFVATTTATLLFAYDQFNRIYRRDRSRSDASEIDVRGTTEVLVGDEG